MTGGLSQGVWTAEAQGRVMEWAAEAVGLRTCGVQALLRLPLVTPVCELPAEEVRSATVSQPVRTGTTSVSSHGAGCCGH